MKICNGSHTTEALPLLPSRRICENKEVNHQTTQVAVVGVGSFGRNHARVYKELSSEGVQLAAVVDANLERAQAVAAEFGGQAFASVGQMLAASPGVCAASVAVPTVAHLETARQLMECGIDVLIEKPLAFTVAEADTLIALARQYHRVCQAGHLERFNPAVRATWAV